MAENEREPTDEAQQREALAQSEKLQAALVAALDAAGAWAEPLLMAHAEARVLQSSLAGLVKLDPSREAWALSLVAQTYQYVADAAADADAARTGVTAATPPGTWH